MLPLTSSGNTDNAWADNVLPATDAVPKPDAQQPAVAAVLKPDSPLDPAATPDVAAVLKPELTDALNRHNLYRQRHQVRTVCVTQQSLTDCQLGIAVMSSAAFGCWRHAMGCTSPHK